MRTVDAEAPARVALAGNPSDGYGGRVLSLAIENFRARVSVSESDRLEIVLAPQDHVRFDDVDDLVADVVANGYYGGLRLVTAAIKRFSEAEAERGTPVGRSAFTVHYDTAIPRAVGLGGSSAIVIATLRALLEFEGRTMDPDALAKLALAVENEELGIAAGLQDRVAQVYGGLTLMDFGDATGEAAGSYRPLDPELLPPLFVAYLGAAGEPSELPHAEIRRRWEAGDQAIAEAMAELAELASAAERALQRGDLEAFGAAMDATFEVRRRLMPLDRRHVEMVERARELGCSANYTGSGGAIVGAYIDAGHLGRIQSELAIRGATVAACRPTSQLVHNSPAARI